MLIVAFDEKESIELTRSFLGEDFSVALAKDDCEEDAASPDFYSLKWNRASPISARSLLIKAQTVLGSVDNILMTFDAKKADEDFSDFSIDEATKACDALILSYQYLTLEAVSRASSHGKKVRLIFNLRAWPSLFEVSRAPQYKKAPVTPVSIFTSVAQKAFESFAENCCAFMENNKCVDVILLDSSATGSEAPTSEAFAAWLNQYLVTLDQAPDSKTKLPNWQKALSKPSSRLSIFRR